MEAWFVYLARCADNSLYCGATKDLARRLAEHNAGAASRYTRSRRPVTLAGSARCRDKSEALRLEAAVKRRPARAKLDFLLGRGMRDPD
ncbi:MAG: GIY-YIG nuclease family protein [Desulfovibrionaceae bacterium]|nr:GIY-YIG nuclease family protein [Desulfovibrionaceae bacterium]MDD4952300.1 GIY-YIG nuclease family protein [Desulfovibrionaceae bacterium]